MTFLRFSHKHVKLINGFQWGLSQDNTYHSSEPQYTIQNLAHLIDLYNNVFEGLASNSHLGYIRISLCDILMSTPLKQEEWNRSCLFKTTKCKLAFSICGLSCMSVKWQKCLRCSLTHWESAILQLTQFWCTLGDFELKTLSLTFLSVHWHIPKNVVRLAALC